MLNALHRTFFECNETTHMSCHPAHHVKGADFTCEKVPSFDSNAVFINALSEEMPECDRKANARQLNSLSTEDPLPTCYVYCAQRSCGAAKQFMMKHEFELSSKCESVLYLHGGALEMQPDELVDGTKCHANIIASNMKKGVQDGCLNCAADEKIALSMTMNDIPVNATLMSTHDTIPDWFLRSGIVSTLPTPFSCDDRYRNAPTDHGPEGGGNTRVRLDISNTDLPKDATLAYWAAHSRDKVVIAKDAYGDFTNSGIVHCKDNVCDFGVDYPGMYTAEGKVFKHHIHFTEWLGTHWNLTAKTIDLE